MLRAGACCVFVRAVYRWNVSIKRHETCTRSPPTSADFLSSSAVPAFPSVFLLSQHLHNSPSFPPHNFTTDSLSFPTSSPQPLFPNSHLHHCLYFPPKIFSIATLSIPTSSPQPLFPSPPLHHSLTSRPSVSTLQHTLSIPLHRLTTATLSVHPSFVPHL